MIDDCQLSEHFSLYELTRTDHTALQEQNRNITYDQVQKLTKLADWLEDPREIVGPMRSHCGYRCDALNGTLPGHSSTSQHPKCEALDFDVPGEDVEVTWQKLYDAAKAGKLPGFGQLILEEANRGYAVSKWVHISIAGTLNPDHVGQVMKMQAGPDGVPHYEVVEKISQ